MRFQAARDLENVNFQLLKILNEGLELGDNFRGGLIEATLSVGENTVRHGLGFRPIGYLVLYKDISGEIFGSRVGEWTTEVLFLQSSVGSQKVRLFVL